MLKYININKCNHLNDYKGFHMGDRYIETHIA